MDEAARQLALVRLAICSGLSNVIHWNNQALRERVLSDQALQGLQLNGIVEWLTWWVSEKGGEVVQRPETRPEWRDASEFVYEILVPVTGLPRDLFVELILHDDDEECPEVTIVSCHLTSFPRGQR